MCTRLENWAVNTSFPLFSCLLPQMNLNLTSAALSRLPWQIRLFCWYKQVDTGISGRRLGLGWQCRLTMALNGRNNLAFFPVCFPFVKVYNICILRGCSIHQCNRNWIVLPAFNSRYFLASFNNIFTTAGELLKGDVSESPGQYTRYFWNLGKTCNLSFLFEKETFSVNQTLVKTCAGV